MSFPAASQVDPARCPLYGGIRRCQPCQPGACICHDCVRQFHGAKIGVAAESGVRSGKFYFENSLIVFTAEYHLRRGRCCGNGCRHCPYPKPLLPPA